MEESVVSQIRIQDPILLFMRLYGTFCGYPRELKDDPMSGFKKLQSDILKKYQTI